MLIELLAAIASLAAVAALLVVLRQAATLQRLRLLAEQSLAGHPQRGGDHACRALARTGPAAPGDRRALRGRPHDAGDQASGTARGQRGEAGRDPEDGERAAARRGREADERKLQPGDRPVRRGAEGDGRRAGGHRADRRHQAPVLQREDARRLGRDPGARDARRHPAARRIRGELQGAARQQRGGGVRRAHADEGRRPTAAADRCEVPGRGLRAAAGGLRRRRCRRRARGVTHAGAPACATRRGRSPASTSIRRSRWSSPCSTCRPTRCTPRWRAFPG